MIIIRRIFHKLRNIFYCRKFAKTGKRIGFSSIRYLVGSKYITIEDDCCFGDELYLTAWSVGGHKPEIRIGKNCSFGSWNHISASNSIVIKDGLLTGKWVSIVDNSHGGTDLADLQIRPWLRPIMSKGPVTIGTNVWIGDKATILLQSRWCQV